METYSLAAITKKIYELDIKLFTLKTLRDILGIRKESVLFNILQRLIKNKVLFKIEKNKYCLKDAKIHDFTLANFLYQPSYISFETALNFYGIISQFPYEITSATPKKTKQKIVNDKVYSYIHLKKSLFWGFEKKGEFLIALPEKAILDQLYLVSKGLRRLSLEECDFSSINLIKMQKYSRKYPQTIRFKKTIRVVKSFKKEGKIWPSFFDT